MPRPKKVTINAEYKAAVDRLIGPRNLRDGEAQKWLASFLKRQDWATLDDPGLWGFHSDEPGKTPPRLQIAVLKLCVELMKRLREQRDKSPNQSKAFRINYDIGAVVYDVVNDLFRRLLPFSERDICEILETTHHD